MNASVRNIVLIISGILTLAGAILFVASIEWAPIPYIYAFGCAGVAVSYLTGYSKDDTLRVRRLQSFLIIAGLLLVASSYLMFHHRQEWIICVLISAILQLYAVYSFPKSKST